MVYLKQPELILQFSQLVVLFFLVGINILLLIIALSQNVLSTISSVLVG